MTMSAKRNSVRKVTEMGRCGCFGSAFSVKPSKVKDSWSLGEPLFDDKVEDGEMESSYDDHSIGTGNEDMEFHSSVKHSEEIIRGKIQKGLICREIAVKESHELIRLKDEDGNKMVNEYVHECTIGEGSYAKVVLYRSKVDQKHYAIKHFHKSHLLKLRLAPSETAMTDVLREVMIMKFLSHPNIVNLVEVIDDPTTNHFYMVLEYLEGKWFDEATGPLGGLKQSTARKYLRDIVSGLMFLHAHNIVHGDIKPDNLLVTASGEVKIGDFSVSQVFENDNDELSRTPGTPVFTAPECCLGLMHRGRAADIWALGVTLYYMVLGNYPFLGDNLLDTYEKIVHGTLNLPDYLNPLLKDLIEKFLCKDPVMRISLEAVAEHSWLIGEEGLIPRHICWCKRNSRGGEFECIDPST